MVTHDEQASQTDYQILNNLLGDILKVEKRGIVYAWFAPWDMLVTWYDIQRALMDLAMCPELAHKAMDRLLNANLCRLEQWRELDLLSFSTGNNRVGSGGLGCIDDLPRDSFEPDTVRIIDQWGCSTAQIFQKSHPKCMKNLPLNMKCAGWSSSR